MNWVGDPLQNLGILQLSFWDGADGTGTQLGTHRGVADSLPIPDRVCRLPVRMELRSATGPNMSITRTRLRVPSRPKHFCCIYKQTQISGGSIFWDDVSLTQAVVEPSDCVAGKRDGSVTSARIDSLGKKDDIRYGKIVARIKPAVDDAAWGAFWMLGSNFPDNGWPRSGEIDITEVFTGSSNNRTTHSTLHWCPKTDAEELNDNCFDDRVFQGGQLDTGSSLGDDFHEFEVVWTPERFVFYIDGQQVWSRVIDPNTMEEFNEDFFLILNLAIGGTLGSA